MWELKLQLNKLRISRLIINKFNNNSTFKRAIQFMKMMKEYMLKSVNIYFREKKMKVKNQHGTSQNPLTSTPML